MKYKLNLFLKNFGVNATPSITFFPRNENEIRNLLEGYKPVLRNYQLVKYEYENRGNITLEKRTIINKCDILDILI